jgi:hypothetical protein
MSDSLPSDSGEQLMGLLRSERLHPASLAQVVERADLAHRLDRKYLVTANTARELVAALADSHHVLQIEDRRYSTYRTTYFDTPDLLCARSHVQGRRRRWKVRTRLYVEDARCRVEVKARSGRGDTIKTATTADPLRYGTLDGVSLAFVQQSLAEFHPDFDVKTLAPKAELAYVRMSLVDLLGRARVTIDWRVRAELPRGRTWVDENYLIVETKGGVRPGTADRALLARGIRPRGFSKYIAMASCLEPTLPDNDIRALRGHLLHSTCAPS